jgi:hypothetical protein
LSDRKYRQHGYQDGGQKPQRESLERPDRKDKDNTFGPRPVNMTATHSVSRCGECGTLLTSISDPLGQCPKCGFELHSCKQCANFDPSSRFECMQRVPERVARKDARNECTFYSISVRVEKQTSTGTVSGPPLSSADAARRALDNLFKD